MTDRFTDAHVRASADLRDLAREYIKQYNGSFQPLIDTKSRHESGSVLTPQNMRMILNTMLSDPNVINMPEPKSFVFDADRFGNRSFKRTPGPSAPPATIRPARLPRRLKINWHGLAYGISNHKQSMTVHTLDRSRCEAVFYPAANEIIWRVYWGCASHTPARPFVNRIALMTLSDALLLVQTGDASHLPRLNKGEKVRAWKWCKQCVRVSHR